MPLDFSTFQPQQDMQRDLLYFNKQYLDHLQKQKNSDKIQLATELLKINTISQKWHLWYFDLLILHDGLTDFLSLVVNEYYLFLIDKSSDPDDIVDTHNILVEIYDTLNYVHCIQWQALNLNVSIYRLQELHDMEFSHVEHYDIDQDLDMLYSMRNHSFNTKLHLAVPLDRILLRNLSDIVLDYVFV